jgi:hypothetical protein
MMTKTTTVGLLAAMFGTGLCGFLGTGAAAQSDAPAQADTAAAKPITIKLGSFFPGGSKLRDGISDTWFSAGAEYAFQPSASSSATSSLIPLAYVDYAETNRHGLDADYVGVGPGVRYYLTPAGTGTLTPYVGAGIGAYFLHASGFGGSDSKTQFGYRLNAGVEFSQSYLFEVNYTDAGSQSGARFNGFTLQLGARF